MIIVPIQKDKIKTSDGQELKVVSYTPFKEGGPAVHCKLAGEIITIYFFDIKQINDITVEYLKSQKAFRAIGKFDRSVHLPQPDDKIIIQKKGSSKHERMSVEVSTVRMKPRDKVILKGAQVKDTNGDWHRFADIVGINRAIGTNDWNLTEFKELYKDYI